MACLAVLAGTPASEAVAWVRENYCEQAVEMPEQEAFATGVTPGSLMWSPDSSQLFVASNSYGESSTDIGRYDLASGRWEAHRVPVGGLHSGILVSPDDARTFLSGRRTDKTHCPAAGTPFPSGRTDVCTFTFAVR